MKIRNGFVSNSSSSSFVVTVKEYNFNKINVNLISNEQEQLLTSFGFKYVKGYAGNIIQGDVSELLNSKDSFSEKENINLYYDVICNEDEVYSFLFKHHIPFLASIHYNDWLWVYDGKSDYYEVIANYPSQFLIHFHWENEKFEKEYFGIQRIIQDIKPYQRIYFNEKENKNYGFIVEELNKAIEELGNKAKEYFTERQFNKIVNFLNQTFRDRLEIKNKRKKLKNED